MLPEASIHQEPLAWLQTAKEKDFVSTWRDFGAVLSSSGVAMSGAGLLAFLLTTPADPRAHRTGIVVIACSRFLLVSGYLENFNYHHRVIRQRYGPRSD
jgi:hypothetical protein